MKPVEDRALVLSRLPYGETSLLVNLLTREHGRVVALAKGAYRLTSGYAGVLDLFHELSVTWQPSARSSIALVRTASVLELRRGVVRDLQRYEAACALLELAGIGAREGAPDPALYRLADEALGLLDAGVVQPRLLSLAFELGFLRCMGLEPALEHCAACGTDLTRERARDVPFAAGAGGRLCGPCAAEARRSGRRVVLLPRPVLRVARGLSQAPLEGLLRIHLDAALQVDLEHFVRRFLEYHLETRLRAKAARA